MAIIIECPDCKGKGTKSVITKKSEHVYGSTTCKRCKGTGDIFQRRKRVKVTCKHCGWWTEVFGASVGADYTCLSCSAKD